MPRHQETTGYVECACCSDVIIGYPGELCDDCWQAECEPDEGCNILTCEHCDVAGTYTTSDEWVPNCDDECEGYATNTSWYENRRPRPVLAHYRVKARSFKPLWEEDIDAASPEDALEEACAFHPDDPKSTRYRVAEVGGETLSWISIEKEDHEYDPQEA